MSETLSPNVGKVVTFTNISDKDFTHAYGGVPFTVRAGESMNFPFDVGTHLARHLSRRILIQQDKGATSWDGKDVTANNGNALQEAAIQGMGILYGPTFIIAEAIRQGRLVPILTEFPIPVLDMFAVFPGNRFVPQRVRAFVDFLAARLGPEPYWDQGLGLE